LGTQRSATTTDALSPRRSQRTTAMHSGQLPQLHSSTSTLSPRLPDAQLGARVSPRSPVQAAFRPRHSPSSARADITTEGLVQSSPRACRASCDPGSSTSDGPPSPPAAAMALLHAVHAAAGPVPVGGDTPGAATWITLVLRSGPLNYVTEQVWLQSVYSVYSVFSILYIQYSVYSVFNAYSLHSCVPA
jgi:hypothetical protein